jgi:hypothetical protein
MTYILIFIIYYENTMRYTASSLATIKYVYLLLSNCG